MEKEHTYVAIDLKSFYASVECSERGLDPLTTNLVVADVERTEKTICLAVSPSLKSYGIPGRARLFEVVQKVREVNARRLAARRGKPFEGSSDDARELARHPEYELTFIAATPQMSHYMQRSTEIYNIYLRYVAPEDIYVYSIDEVFMDVTAYLDTYAMSAEELTRKMIHDVLLETGITATAGIAPNLYLAKVAMDIVAKHMPADEHGVRIACIDEQSYRELLWDHRPLTDFWRVGPGYCRKLEKHGIFTMGDVARTSLTNEDLFYHLFGVNAELLIDHAWGWEPCTLEEIHKYKPQAGSLSQGQVLTCPYDYEKGRLVVREMTDQLVLDLLDKGMTTDQIVLTVGYDIENLTNPEIRRKYKGEITTDWYGRQSPKHAHGTINLDRKTSSARLITDAVMQLYDQIVDPVLLIRRFYVVASRLTTEAEAAKQQKKAETFEQMDLFTDYSKVEEERKQEDKNLEKERKAQEAMLALKKKFGKNAVLKGMNLQEGGTTIARNKQIGGHKA